jgi:hypothetical protein
MIRSINKLRIFPREYDELWWVGKQSNNKSDIGAAQSEIVFYIFLYVNPSSDWTSPTSLFCFPKSKTPSSIIFSLTYNDQNINLDYIYIHSLILKIASKNITKFDIWSYIIQPYELDIYELMKMDPYCCNYLENFKWFFIAS